jgi:MFS family permease
LGERSALSDVMSIYVPSFFIFLGMSLISPILPLYARSFDVSYALASLAIPMYAIGRLLADIPTGIAADRLGRKPTILFSLVVTGASYILFPVTSDYLQLSLTAVLLGIGNTGAGQAPLALATDASISEPKVLSMGLYRLFGDVGFIVGPIALGLIVDYYGLRMPFYFTALLVFINAFLILPLAEETYSKRRLNRSK